MCDAIDIILCAICYFLVLECRADWVLCLYRWANYVTQNTRIPPKSVRFMLDGENIDPESTPAALDLDDDDQIDCFLAQWSLL